MLTFRVLSALLHYPDAGIVAHRAEMAAALKKENLLLAEHLRALEGFLDGLGRRDLLDLEADYVEAFDRTRTLSLHLFEHIHGESRDRGQAMVDLLAHYRRSGLELVGSELPDYLPLFLEFLALRPLAEAQALLGEVVDIVALIAGRLQDRGSPYAPVCAAVVALSAMQPDRAAIAARLNAAADAGEGARGEAVDEEWTEPAVTFGPAGATGEDSSGCPLAEGAVARMNAGR